MLRASHTARHSLYCVCGDSVATLAFARMFGCGRGSGCFNRACDWSSLPRIVSAPRRRSGRVARAGFAGGIRSLRLTAIVTVCAGAQTPPIARVFGVSVVGGLLIPSPPPSKPPISQTGARRRNRVPGSIFARADDARPRPSGRPREEIEPGTVLRPLDESRSIRISHSPFPIPHSPFPIRASRSPPTALATSAPSSGRPGLLSRLFTDSSDRAMHSSADAFGGRKGAKADPVWATLRSGQLERRSGLAVFSCRLPVPAKKPPSSVTARQSACATASPRASM